MAIPTLGGNIFVPFQVHPRIKPINPSLYHSMGAVQAIQARPCLRTLIPVMSLWNTALRTILHNLSIYSENDKISGHFAQ